MTAYTVAADRTPKVGAVFIDRTIYDPWWRAAPGESYDRTPHARMVITNVTAEWVEFTYARANPEAMVYLGGWPVGQVGYFKIGRDEFDRGYPAAAEDDPTFETIAERVHEAWMATKRAQGITSRLSEWGEEQMVPYADLSERAKDLDRETARAALRAGLEAPGPPPITRNAQPEETP